MAKAKFIVPVKIEKATPLLKVAKKAGIDLKAPCKKGKCEKCAILVSGDVSPVTSIERKFFSEDELKAGYRLACLVKVYGKCKIELL